MFDAKLVADFITATRGMLGFLIIWLGFTQGEYALPTIGLLMLLDWTGDFVDGGIAKRSRQPRHSWIGDNDLYVDVFMSVCLGIYLVSAGFVGLTFGLLPPRLDPDPLAFRTRPQPAHVASVLAVILIALTGLILLLIAAIALWGENTRERSLVLGLTAVMT